MKKILVPLEALSRDPNDPKLPLHAIRFNYLRKFAKYNLIPLLVSYEMPPEAIAELYNESSGMIVIGGLDFNPEIYGEQPQRTLSMLDNRRDALELQLMKQVLKDRKPFLGICRGMQLLNIASGGSLYQHIPDTFSGEEHSCPTYDDMEHNRHEIVIDKNSRLFGFLGKEKISVNSRHHQAVKNPGTNLTIVAKSPAGVPEAIEHEDKTYFCFGVQSHPEAEEDGNLEILFQEFAKAIKYKGK